jgi:enoyl-[acyl-carrier protein] reductase II
MNKITTLFDIQFPIIQAGMVWCSGWKLASVVSNAGGLGLLGAGSMYPEVLKEHIRKTKAATNKPFGVNLPLLYPHIEALIDVVIQEKVPIVFTSAGNPNLWTARLQSEGIKVVHVVSSLKFALKAQDAKVDAIVAEGFEAGGHNGKDETTSFCLLPMLRRELSIPLIAAGGIATGQQMLAAMVLGADGVQIGSRFAISSESSAHDNFKNAVIRSKEGDTVLTLKSLTPVRLLKNAFYDQIQRAEARAADPQELRSILDKGRSRKGIFEGDLVEGELEIGQVSALIDEIKPAAEILQDIWQEYIMAKQAVLKMP